MAEELDMLEFVRRLNHSITTICRQYALLNRIDLIDDVKEMMPNVQKFALWFIGEQDIGVSEEEKQIMNREMLAILQDITDALEFNDSVLMYDALECGIAEYLRLFIPEEEQTNE